MPVRGSISGEIKGIQRRLPAFFNTEARRASRDMADEIRERTPVGRRIDPVTGRDLGPSGALRRSIEPVMPRRIGRSRWIAGAESNLSYASHVEYGTRAHVIQGKTHLAFWSQGKLNIRAKVNHPGTEGHFMFLRGVEDMQRRYTREANFRVQRLLDGKDYD